LGWLFGLLGFLVFGAQKPKNQKAKPEHSWINSRRQKSGPLAFAAAQKAKDAISMVIRSRRQKSDGAHAGISACAHWRTE
jgi:hypothetical protein